MPTASHPLRASSGVLTAAAAKVERTAETAGPLGLLAIQQRADTCRRDRSITFPGCEPNRYMRAWFVMDRPPGTIKAAPAHDHAGSLHKPHAHQLLVPSAPGVGPP